MVTSSIWIFGSCRHAFGLGPFYYQNILLVSCRSSGRCTVDVRQRKPALVIVSRREEASTAQTSYAIYDCWNHSLWFFVGTWNHYLLSFVVLISQTFTHTHIMVHTRTHIHKRYKLTSFSFTQATQLPLMLISHIY